MGARAVGPPPRSDGFPESPFDPDLAALLIALLRGQGTPARYVQGTIELPVARLAELMGLLTAAEVEALYGEGGSFQLPAAARDQGQVPICV